MHDQDAHSPKKKIQKQRCHKSNMNGLWRRLCCHPCRVKISLVTCSNRVYTSINNSLFSIRCRSNHKPSKEEDFLPLKTKLFLHSQSDQIKANAPTLMRILYLLSIPHGQLPNILATLLGGYKLEAIWMTDHIERAKLHWKEQVFDCLIVVTKKHIVDVHSNSALQGCHL
jgi:hypothetical protein